MSLIIVHRLLQGIIFPPLNSILLIILGLFLMRYYKKTGKALIIVSICLLYISSIPYTAYRLNKWLELPPITNEKMKTVQAIVVLGGGLNINSFEYPGGAVVNTETLIRLNYTAYLARKYPNLPIVTSGGYNGIRYTEAKVMRDTLLNNYMLTNTIWIEDSSRNTDENAKYVAQLLHKKNITTIALVSQAYHLKRASMSFHKYGLTPIAAPTDYIYSADATSPILAFIPSATAIKFNVRALHEIIGYWVYKNFD